jgi:hypothetical protein
MKTTETLENVINIVTEKSANHFDQLVAVEEMRFSSLREIDISGQSFRVLTSAQRLLANRLRVPYSYLFRCPEELQANNLNYWIDQEARNRQSLFCRFDGNHLRAVFMERYTPIDNLEVLHKMADYGFDLEQKIQFSMDEEMMLIKVPDYHNSFLLSRYDRIVPGISIVNSEVGILALSIEAFYYRLVCTNGLISKTKVDARYKHISRKVMDEFPMVLEGVVCQSRHGRDRFRISAETNVDNPGDSIEAFVRQFQISQEQTQIIKRAFYEEPGSTMFHIINAFTRAAQDNELSATETYQLEKTAGTILGMVKS